MAKNRMIFEEVAEGARAAAPPVAAGAIGRREGARRAIRAWLVVLFALVVAMIAVGGATRLTDSGLSITEWRPVTGALPPLSEADWQAEFDRYRQIPQYQLVNRGMSLEDFKVIYWWEWGHRQLGRVIGLVWAAGFLGFLAARRIPAGWTPRLLGLGVLGGLQGAIGWWMVHSGLQEGMVSVASYRLAVHLGLAFVILGLIAWFVMQLTRSEATLLTARRGRERRLWGISTGLMHLAFLQIVLGALVAGIDAGRSFPEWPLMAGQIVPPDPFYVADGGPAWRAFFENPGLVQFVHRTTGYLVLLVAFWAWLAARRSPNLATRRAFGWVLLMGIGQVVLGIGAVLTAAQLHVALTHQVGAVILWMLILRARHTAGYPVAGSIAKGTA